MPETRTWRDVTACGWTVFFHYCSKEIMCPTHGRVQEVIPWADPYARITYRLEYNILIFSQLMTQKAAAEIIHVSQGHRRCCARKNGAKYQGLSARH